MPRGSLQLSLCRKIVLLPAALLFCVFVCQAYGDSASTEQWNISADKIARYENPNTIVAKGNVVLIKREKMAPGPSAAEQQAAMWSELLEEKPEKPAVAAEDIAKRQPVEYRTTMTIKADWIVYDVDLKLIRAKGNVHITTQEDQLSARSGTLNLIDETGQFTDASVHHQNNTLYLEGKKIEKTGLDTYRIKDGWVITCNLAAGQTPPWSFASTETNVRQNGFAFLKNAKFEIRNVPVFYMPYLIVPVKSSRQTGFIFPEFSTSKNNGFGFNFPFFINISDSADATLYPEYLSNRGFMPGGEFRYVAGASDKGVFNANFLDDKLSDPSQTTYYSDTGYTHDNSDRYWLRGKVDHTFGDWQTRLDMDIVSDQDYLSEFDTGETGFDKTQYRYLGTFGRGFQNKTDTNRENTIKTLRSWNGSSLQMNLLAINDADTNASDTNTPLWQLPSIDYSGVVPVGDSYFSFDWDTNYVDYWREDGIGGHRFDMHPTISTPLPLGAYLESRAEVGLRDTFYVVQTYGEAEWDNDNLQNRLIPDFETEVATTLERDFSLSRDNDRILTHQVRPYIQYGYIPKVNQDKLPQFDDIDTIEDENAVTYGIDNYLSTFGDSDKIWSSLKDFAELKIEQSYDLRSEQSDQPFSDIYSELKWWPLSGISISYKGYYNVYGGGFNQHLFEGLYSNSRGDILSVDYSFNKEQDIEQLNTTFLAHILNGWYVGGKVEHSISQDETVEARGYLAYQAPCWAVKFETKYTPEDTAYLVVFSLANIGTPLGISL